ncbi:hypothetical protein [Arthrobacter sp. NPDC056727]|uniref:hypothetical protein n=1 Tax=Arthrobacter sp. NPDC056727 TaxID=3345927 RepID=UPI00367190B2
MKDDLTHAAISFLSSLQLGEWVEVLDNRNVVQWRGAIEETAPELGVAWLRTELGERRLLDIQEHIVKRFRQEFQPLQQSGPGYIVFR